MQDKSPVLEGVHFETAFQANQKNEKNLAEVNTKSNTCKYGVINK